MMSPSTTRHTLLYCGICAKDLALSTMVSSLVLAQPRHCDSQCQSLAPYIHDTRSYQLGGEAVLVDEASSKDGWQQRRHLRRRNRHLDVDTYYRSAGIRCLV